MIVLIWLTLLFSNVFVFSSQNFSIEENDEFNFFDDYRYFLFPDGDGILHIVDREETELIKREFNAGSDVVFLLYTRKNPDDPYSIIKYDENIFTSGNFNESKPIKMIIHGWKSCYTSRLFSSLVPALLAAVDANVIVVDWSAGSSGIYPTACLNVPKVGEEIALFVNWLSDIGIPPSKIHFLGYSLGAHAAGIAGRNIKNGSVSLITALDPAGPLWTRFGPRLKSTDANYVEVIHTNAGMFGLMAKIGDVDFYPNGGMFMPGCGVNLSCSHTRSYEYYIETIDSEHFVGDKCNNFAEIYRRRCANLARLVMGGLNPKESDGVFYLETNAQKPFCRNSMN